MDRYKYVLAVGALACAPLAGGCLSAGVAQAASSSAAAAPAVALLPLTITFDAILLGLLGAASTSQGPPPPGSFATAGWSDPDDWVADCSGPIFCEPHEHFVCSGPPGGCACHCEVSAPACVPAIPEEEGNIACPETPERGRVAAR